MTVETIKEKIELGLPLDSSVNFEFEKKLRHKNFIFSEKKLEISSKSAHFHSVF
ncbi:MAG: hypothetical protein VXY27_05115 [Thermoproteota archaeon]|nr:hypothetical protein [Thermoproteota archaeon]